MDRQLVIAGFHRSGTSLLTELLHQAGLFVGDELLGARPSNLHGHFEDLEVLHLHEDVLRANQLSWQVDLLRPLHIAADHWRRMADIVADRRSRHRLWGFKDPRACFFLGAWEHVLPDMNVIAIYRDPADCVHSLERRHASQLVAGEGDPDKHLRFWREPDHALRMWIAHNEAILAFAGQHPDRVALVSFRDLQRGFPVVSALRREFGLGLSDVPTYSVLDPTVTEARPTRLPVGDQRVRRRMQAVWDRLELRAARFVEGHARAA